MTYNPPDKAKLAEILRSQGDDDEAIARNLGGYKPTKTRTPRKAKDETPKDGPSDKIDPGADAQAAGLALVKPETE